MILVFIYKTIVRHWLFLFDPEWIHNRIIKMGVLFGRFGVTRKIIALFFNYSNPLLEQDVAGIHFNNPVGLSAGFDKNGELVDIIPSVGFGFEEVGTVTRKPYEGNPRPRLKRLIKSQSILVNYGLKNDGIDIILNRLKKRKVTSFPLGISIGKTNNECTAEVNEGIADYIGSFRRVKESGIGSYYALNISCPNILQTNYFIRPKFLGMLLKEIAALNLEKPVFIKMPIHIEWVEFKKLLDEIRLYPIAGVIIGNLAKNRKSSTIKDTLEESDKGNMSGKPTEDLSNELITKTYQYCGDSLVIVGVGGIFSAEDAYEKIARGASIVQLITGMIYKGPAVISEINQGLVKKIEEQNASSITDLIGIYYKKNEPRH